ncbi:hypothetical protein [Sulfurimonas paralvinellae]|uniref:Mobilization protein n=1 Tax=Sulfurimonas paralvinellae TaxID=317658 RepID=A0A7M1BAK5_9BACT|nr:hypothetical protein [Sulfurimonas paralvinellae]QOP45858.1 hypothetical protein FM071_05970 [Sulfurimonas paralvinellae]
MSKLKQIKVNVTCTDYETIQQQSAKKNVTMAEYIRQKLDITIGTHAPPASSTYFQRADPALLFELNTISKSLNIIASNITKDIEIDSFLLVSIYKQVMSLKC